MNMECEESTSSDDSLAPGERRLVIEAPVVQRPAVTPQAGAIGAKTDTKKRGKRERSLGRNPATVKRSRLIINLDSDEEDEELEEEISEEDGEEESEESESDDSEGRAPKSLLKQDKPDDKGVDNGDKGKDVGDQGVQHGDKAKDVGDKDVQHVDKAKDMGDKSVLHGDKAEDEEDEDNSEEEEEENSDGGEDDDSDKKGDKENDDDDDNVGGQREENDRDKGNEDEKGGNEGDKRNHGDNNRGEDNKTGSGGDKDGDGGSAGNKQDDNGGSVSNSAEGPNSIDVDDLMTELEDMPVPDDLVEINLEEADNYQLKVTKNCVTVRVIDLAGLPFIKFGRERLNQMVSTHRSISRFHAVLQYKAVHDENAPTGWYLYDMESTMGSFVNGRKVPPRRFVLLDVGSRFQFGNSTRLYQILKDGHTGDAPSTSCVYAEMRANLMLDLLRLYRSVHSIRQREIDDDDDMHIYEAYVADGIEIYGSQIVSFGNHPNDFARAHRVHVAAHAGVDAAAASYGRAGYGSAYGNDRVFDAREVVMRHSRAISFDG